MEKLKKGAQNFSRAIVIPVLFLPVVGIMVAFCSIFINPSIVEAVPFLNNSFIQIIFTVFYKALMVIFQNLGPIFAIGIALGLAKKKKEQAALVTFISLFLYLAAQNTYLSLTDKLVPVEEMTSMGQTMTLGFQVIDMGVFIGLIIGVIVSIVFNKYCDKDLGSIFSVYGGARFVFIVSIPIMVLLAIINTMIWPPIQEVLNSVSHLMTSTGGFGYFLFGFLERLLLPTGLHHLIGSPIWYTELGGVQMIDGEKIVGAWNIAITELNNSGIAKLSATAIFNNTNLVKIFGLSGAGLAMISCATPEKKKMAKAILIPAILTSVLAGITEPIEFTFLFLSPALFLVHSLLTGGFFFILRTLNIVTITAGGLIETLALNLPVGNSKSNYLLYFLVGLVQLVIYYVVFKWFILKFDLATPGRDGGLNQLVQKKDYEDGKQKKQGTSDDIGAIILAAIGGPDNIVTIDNCFTRLRLELVNPEIVDQDSLTENDAKAVIVDGKNVQVVYGPNVTKYRDALENTLE